jgi:tetratricopeptide (TPR) repeat protein
MEALLCPACGTANSEFDSRCVACGAALPNSSSATKFFGSPPAEAAPAGAARPVEEPFASGQVSHYRLLRPLGRGGMGIVYLAQDVDLGREVALKFLHHWRAVRPADEVRFRREAQAAAALDHPNIGTIYEVGEHEGMRFLAMAYYHGTTLSQLLDRQPDRRLPVSEAAAIAGQLASALATAHAAGIVHRDLKPDNVMVLPDGRVKLLDFGLARWVDSGGITEEGMAVGTAAYMAPEQLQGQRTGPAADLWALGVVLYEMLAGQRPFGGERQGMIHSILYEDPPSLREARPDVPPALERIVSHCLVKEPGNRWPAAADVLSELQAAGLVGSTGGGLLSLPRRRSRRPWGIAAAAIVLLSLAVAAYFLWIRKPAPIVYVAVLKPVVTGSLQPGDQARVAANVQAALLRTVAALEGLAALDPAQVNAIKGSTTDVARAVAAGEVLTAGADCVGDVCQVSLSRLAGKDGRVLWTEVLQQLPPSKPRLFADAVAACLRQGYSSHELRVPSLALKISEADYRNYLELRQSLGDPQRFPEILSGLAGLRQRAPDFIDAYTLEAKLSRRLYSDTGDTRHLEHGLTVARQALERAAGDPRPLEALFDLDLTAGRVGEAESVLAKLEEVNPPASLFRRGQLAESQGRPQEALELMSAAARLQPSWLLSVANAEYRHSRFDDARRHLEDLLARSPGNVEGLKLLAQIELLRHPDQAVALLRKVAKSDPGPDSLTNLGASLLLLRRYAEAEEPLRRALVLKPGDPSAALNLADCLLLLGQRTEAQQLYSRVAATTERSAPGDWQLLSVRAQALAHLGQTVKAVETIQTALRLTPDNAQLAYEAAVVYSLIGDRGSAIFQARQAITRGEDPNSLALPFFDPLRQEPDFQALDVNRPRDPPAP